MSKKPIFLLLVAVLTFGMSSALAVPYDATHASGQISFSGKNNKYSVTYHTNGGSGNAPVDSNKYAKSASVTLLGQGNMTPPSGKTFAGWSTDANATYAAFPPGTAVTITANIDLYAVWSTGTAINVAYTYIDSSGNRKLATKTYVQGEIISMPTLASFGWNEDTGFNGWFTDTAMIGTAITPGTANMITDNCTFYGRADASATIEFPVTITWDDSNNADDVRPSPNDVIANMILSPAPVTDVTVTAVDTSGNTWTIVYANLNIAAYTAVVNIVEGYTISISSKNTFTFVRDKPRAVAATVTANNRTYDETEMALVTVDDSTLVGGTMQYALGTDTIPTSDWTSTIPTGTEIGTYYVWYKAVGDENHASSSAVCVTVNIVPVYDTPNFTMPSRLTTIEENAFEGITALSVVDAQTCTSIRKWAFKDSGVTQIKLPMDCDIDEDAFSGCGTVYVYAPVGGMTQTFCDQASNLIFVESDSFRNTWW